MRRGKEEIMSEALRILVVAGHPADMFDHCGGTLLHHIEKGDKVTCVSVTQGLRIHDEVVYDLFRHDIDQYSKEEIDEIIRQRQQVKYGEALAACALFGLTDVRFLDYDDEILTVTPEMISRLARVIREVQPDLVITHWPYQYDMFSNHHAVTGQLTLGAITAANGVSFSDRNPACRIGQVAFMLCPHDVAASVLNTSGKTAYASYYVDVTDVVDQKVKALHMMKSQKYDTEGYAKKTTEQWNGNFGIRVRFPYAEGFAFEYPEVGRTILVSDHRKWLAKADERELLKRCSGLQGIHVNLD